MAFVILRVLPMDLILLLISRVLGIKQNVKCKYQNEK